MQFGNVEYYVPGETSGAADRGSMKAKKPVARKKRNAALFIRLDVNKDGHITNEEVRERMPDDPKGGGTNLRST